MRGLLFRLSKHTPMIGITPAHAGLTGFSRTLGRSSWDHPRACGAYLDACCGSRMFWGSPPRMRGLQGNEVYEDDIVGITPAHAGLTIILQINTYGMRDHPRACGAYSSNLI